MMEKVILGGLSERFFTHYNEITKEYSITAVAKSSSDKEGGIIGIKDCPVYSFRDIDVNGQERILIVSLSRIKSIIKELLALGIDHKRLIIWTPKRCLKESDYSLTINEDATVSAIINMDGKTVRFTLKEYSDFFIFEEIYLKNTYHFITNKDCILFDIGLNIGLASIFFASKDYVKKIYSFEPFKPSFDRAVANIALNDPVIKDKINVYNYGLSDVDRRGCYTYLEGNPGIMRTEGGSNPAKIVDDHAEEAELKEAGTELKKIIESDPNAEYVIKMDCEGAEYTIIPNLLKHDVLSHIRLIIMETHDEREDEIADLIAGQGFTVYSDRPSSHLTGKLIAVKNADIKEDDR
ncbi:MAG TPA: hypothetical protein DCG85_00785 [Lachnospiraceae bacterium]|nr:hypothetical protein [Lachnospiraceae bacterium]